MGINTGLGDSIIALRVKINVRNSSRFIFVEQQTLEQPQQNSSLKGFHSWSMTRKNKQIYNTGRINLVGAVSKILEWN